MTSEDELFAQLEDEMSEMDLSDVVDVQTLSMVELLDLHHKLENDLFDMRQAIHPSNQDARDKHSLRNAIKVEIARRTNRTSS